MTCETAEDIDSDKFGRIDAGSSIDTHQGDDGHTDEVIKTFAEPVNDKFKGKSGGTGIHQDDHRHTEYKAEPVDDKAKGKSGEAKIKNGILAAVGKGLGRIGDNDKRNIYVYRFIFSNGNEFPLPNRRHG